MTSYKNIGICSLNLHHVLPIILGEDPERLDTPKNLIKKIESDFDFHRDEFIIAYHRSVFPKSAIGLSVDIFDALFEAFKVEANESFPIYVTEESSPADKSAKIEEWQNLNHSELLERRSDNFMKNLIAEYYFGYYTSITPFALSASNPEEILRIDSSEFIQKLLRPTTIFSLADFLTTNVSLDEKVDRIFNSLSAHDRVAQMLMPAAETAYRRIDSETNVPDYTTDGDSIDVIKTLLSERKIGGVLLLKGSKDQVTRWSDEFLELNERIGNLPLFISADAEPSLLNDYKINGLPEVRRVKYTTTIIQVEETANKIADIISEFGVNYNFAPVVDVGKNKTAGWRGYAFLDVANNIPFSKKFIETTQSRNIIATAKHFPGHGLITGDTHEGLQVIDGELKELKYYPPLIEDGLLSIMIAHIAVENNTQYNTDGLPSTLSKTIVTDLLRDELGFKGLIVTDAMNMGGVTHVPDGYVKAVEAGIDILEMPESASQAHSDILTKYNTNTSFQEKVDRACMRIVRMKICLELI